MNAIYSGKFVTEAKREFSNSQNSNVQKWKAYVKGDAKSILKLKGYGVRIVSIPNMSLFDSQGSKYVNKVIPLDCKNIISIEAGSTYGWGKYVGRFGASLGVDSFGLSATPEENYAHFGLTKEHIALVAENLIKKNK